MRNDISKEEYERLEKEFLDKLHTDKRKFLNHKDAYDRMEWLIVHGVVEPIIHEETYFDTTLLRYVVTKREIVDYDWDNQNGNWRGCYK